MNITLEEALTKVPTKGELWQVVREARDYLSWYLQAPELAVDPKYGEILFDAGVWGRKMVTAPEGNKACFVCLAGLWYLKELGVLLNEMESRLPPVADYLDDLRHPEPTNGSRILGIDIPEDLGYTLLEGIGDDDYYDEDNPTHVLVYLDWLLLQHDTPTTDTHKR